MVPSEASTKLIVGGGGKFLRARVDLAGQHLLPAPAAPWHPSRLLLHPRKGESVARSHAFNNHFAGLANSVLKHCSPAGAHQYTGTAVNETLVAVHAAHRTIYFRPRA